MPHQSQSQYGILKALKHLSMHVVLIGMTDNEIIHLVWNMLILKQRFENDPYSLTYDEIETLREYNEYQDQKLS
jgi:hypothetical protein